ncbi:MAG TPA: DUF3124 domain-containing protein [Pirellulales bacterium]|jgi:hypothetical protein
MRSTTTGPAAKISLGITVTILVCAAVSYSLQARLAAAEKTPIDKPAAVPSVELIYLPIYSSIFYENGKHTLELAATVSIHNINPTHAITVTRADYYDTKGRLIKKYLDKPLALAALQTSNLVVDKADTAGGTGANFLIEWKAESDAASPLVEAVMINASSNLGIAFTTTGRVVNTAALTK